MIKKSVTRLSVSGLAIAAMAAMVPGTALAQANVEDAEAAEGNANTIVVTSRKREENLIAVPLAVTVATQEQLQRDQVYNITDLQRVAPALEVSQTFGGESNGGGRLRGLGTIVFNPSVASSVALVIDQLPVGNLNFPVLYDLAQVEVLRGPQGTLFGQGASAGVLNITTRLPEFGVVAMNGSVDYADKGSAGSEVGELVFNGGLNLPIADNMAVRFAGQWKRETGLQRSATTGEDNRLTYYAMRGRLLWEPSDTVSVTLSGEAGKETNDGQTFFAIAVTPNRTTVFDPPGPAPAGPLGELSTAAYTNPAGCAVPVINARAEWYCEAAPSLITIQLASVSALVDIELTDTLSLTSASGFRSRESRTFSRDFSRILPQAAARQERTLEQSNGFSQELRLTYLGDGIDVVGGVYYSDYEFDRDPIGDSLTFGSTLPGERIGFSVCPFSGVGFCPVAPNLTDESTENRTVALFADATFAITDQIDLFGGLRYDDYKNTTAVQIFAATTGPLRTQQLTDNAISGRIGLSYMPSPDVNFYGSFSRGYKPPAVGTNPTGTLFQLAPETVDAFELGAKFGLGGMQVATNLFYSDISNFQSQRSEFAGTALVSVPFSVPQLRSKGFEVNVFGELMEGLNINAGYQLNVIKYPTGIFGDDAIDTNGDQVFDSNIIPGLPFRLDGRQFLNAPRHKFTLSGDYSVPVNDSLEVFLNANLVYKSDVLLANRADPAYVYPAHEIINGGFGIRDSDGGWTASVFVRNLTKEREPTAYLASTFSGQADGGIRAWPVAGLTARVVGVRLGVDF